MERIIKKILAIAIIIILIFMSSLQVISYAETVLMYAKGGRQDGKLYSMRGEPIYDYSYSNDEEGDLYCMQIGAHLNLRGSGAETYQKYSLNSYMKNNPTATDVSNLEAATGAKLKTNVGFYDNCSINDSTKVTTLKAIMWIIKNMYVIPSNSDNSANEKVWMRDNITAIMERYCSNDLKPSKNQSININKLNDEELRVIQQLALWRFMGIASYTSESDHTYGRIGNSGVWSADDLIGLNTFNTDDKRNNGYALYSALLSGAIKNANSTDSFSIQYSSNGNATVTNNSKGIITLVDQNNHLYRFGPINIKLANLKTFKAKVNVNNLLSTNSVTSAYLGDANKNSIVALNTNGSYTGDIQGKINKKNIYVYIKTKNILSENENAKVTLTYNYEYNPGLADNYDINLYWRKNGYEVRQPILEIKKQLSKYDGREKSTSAIIKNVAFDLALTKEISNISRYNQASGKYEKVNSVGSRAIERNYSVLNKTNTSKYIMNKTPIYVIPGDIIEYEIKIFNEGSKDGYVKQIKDYLPKGLELYGNQDSNIVFSKTESNDYNIIRYNFTGVGQKASYTNSTYPRYCFSVKVKCIVTDEAKVNEILLNIATISNYRYKNESGNIIECKNDDIDRDSKQNNITNNYKSYRNDIINQTKGKNLDKIDKGDYVYEDDEDFEQVKVGYFDLALRKYVDRIYDEKGNDITIASRAPKIYSDTTKHYSNGGTTALYHHKKVPLEVKNGYIIRYKIRVYNEGYISGYATKVVDYLPEGLQLIDGDSENNLYNWQKSSDGRTIYTEKLKDKLIEPSYGTTGFSKLMNDEARANDTNPGFFKDIILKCKVNYTGSESHKYLTNVAEIQSSKYTKADGTTVTNGDIDSQGNNVFNKDSNVTNVDTYRQAKHNGRIAKGYSQGIWYNGDNIYYGVEDDDDFENLIIYKYDIALRKYISEITKKDGTKITPNDRTPKFDGTNIQSNHNAIYRHKKDPIEVEDGDTILYKLRIYNEGKTDAVVKELVDYLPEGLELDTSNANNWVASGTVNGMTKLVRNKQITVPAGTTRGL